MADYTSTIEGFQRLMQGILVGSGDEAKSFLDAVVTPDFYHVRNGKRSEYDTYLSLLTTLRGQISNYNAKVVQFLRDGNQLAARVVGSFTLQGQDLKYENFIFGSVHSSGKIEWLVEHSAQEPSA